MEYDSQHGRFKLPRGKVSAMMLLGGALIPLHHSLEMLRNGKP
jgi:hypothetical protein